MQVSWLTLLITKVKKVHKKFFNQYSVLGETCVHEVCKLQNLEMAEMILSRSSQLSILNNRSLIILNLSLYKVQILIVETNQFM